MLRKRVLAWTRQQVEALLTAEVERAGGEVLGPYGYMSPTGETQISVVHVTARMPAQGAKREAFTCAYAQWRHICRGLELLTARATAGPDSPLGAAYLLLGETIKARLDPRRPPEGAGEEVARNFGAQPIDIWLTRAQWRIAAKAHEAASLEAAQAVMDRAGKK